MARLYVLKWVTIALLGEREWLPLRAAATQPTLYSELDRFRSEAELRAALALPVFVLGCALAVRTTPAVLGAVILAGGLLASVVLAYGWRQAKPRANATLFEGIQARLIDPPSLAEARLKELLEEGRRAGRGYGGSDYEPKADAQNSDVKLSGSEP